MNHLKIRQLLVITMFLPLLSQAQQVLDSLNKKEDSVKAKNIFIASISYQTNLHYFGRTDSLQSIGLFPSVGFELKNGLYATGNFIFFQNAVTPTTYTGTTVEAGYRFKIKKHINGNVFYTQILYKDKSMLVQSSLKSQTGINAAYTNKIININAGADVKFSDKTDVGATFGLDHLFIYNKGMKNMAIAINPSAYLYAGTQNFTNTYLEKKNILGLPVTQQTTEHVTNFNILAYEFSMPIVFVIGKFNASVTPSYVMPQNLVTVANNPSQSEKGKDIFYATFNIGVRL